MTSDDTTEAGDGNVDRLAALRRTGLLDTPPEEAFDRLTRLAAVILEAPVALVSLVERDRQFFKSAVGFPEGWSHARETPLSHSLCQHVVSTGVPLAVEDAREHPVLASSPAIEVMGMVSYAGVPLSASDGHVLGAFCVLDAHPRPWTDREVAVLRDLAASVVTEIELRRDASIRAAVQEELRRERDFVLQLVNTMGQGLTVADREGRLRFVNPQFARLAGRDTAEVLGAGWEELLHPDDRAALGQAREQWRGGETVTWEMRLLRPDGGAVPCLATSAPRLEGGGVAGSITVVSNLTQRKRAEEELRRSEELFRQFVEAASDLIYRADPGGRITYANPVAAQLLGYAGDELAGTRFIDLVRDDWRERVRELYLRQAEERVASTYYEFPVVARDGRELWIGQNAQLVAEDGRPAGWQAVARDITGRREIDRMKDEFISVVSHELRTPLASMRGSLGLVASGLTGALDDRGKRLVEIALQNTDRLARLVDDILDTERIAAGKLPVEPRPADAAELMERAAEPLREMAERAGVALEVEPLPAALLADPDRVIQTLTNLLANAIKFSPAGGAVRLDARPRGGWVLFRVADQGPGIPRDRRDVIFEPFRQLDSSDSRRKGGTGLGLAICRSIVREHGGEIWVEDAPTGGSVFCFTLPAGAAPGGPDVAEPAPDRNPRAHP
ncbi:MAG TPA: PAS domain S-box protein [Longimicrobiaceae bacterium]|nr:PAS domain S-box protein [Longimicrobiaceae bacterium]